MSNRCPACDAMVVGNEAYCRQCSTPLTSNLPPVSSRMRWLIRTRALVLINCLAAVGPMFMLIVGPSALIGAPILIVLGMGLFFMARQASYPAAMKLGLLQALTALIWAPIILVLWNTSGAIVVISIPLVLLAMVALFIASLCVYQAHPARELRLHCDHCGYCLKGQLTPRCPECGHTFDPERMVNC